MRCVFVASVLLFGVPAFAQSTGYFVGNSLTQDANPQTIGARAADIGRDLHAGWHIRGGQGLHSITSDPDTFSTVSSHGPFDEALPAHDWDFVTMQPFWQVTARTFSFDIAAVELLIDSARAEGRNSDTTFYVYTGWAGNPAEWDRPLTDPINPRIDRSKAYTEFLVEQARDRFGVTVELIPVGGVFHVLSELVDQGQIPGVSDYEEFFRDPTHASIELGRYVAQTTMLSATLKLDPRAEFAGYSSANYGVETYDAVHNAIWDVLIESDYLTIPAPSAALPLLGVALVMPRRRRAV
jgi:hypothetical protein